MARRSSFDLYLEDLCNVLGHQNRREPFQCYCKGLMLPLQRKSVEPLAAHIDPSNVRSRHQSLHHFVADSPWSDDRLLERVYEHVNKAMGEQDIRYLLVDDTGIPKKGKYSVGVSHQYCGQLGKRANCQDAVSVSLATEHASIPIDYRLYLPKTWTDSPERMSTAGVPDDVIFQTKPQIALDQIQRAIKRGVDIDVVVADAGYGNEYGFREALDVMGLPYMVGIRTNTNVWAPWTEPKAERQTASTRTPPSRQRFAKNHKPVSVAELAGEIHKDAWRRVTWREGTNETLHSRFAALRVSIAYRDRPNRLQHTEQQWLLVEWPRDEPEPTKYWLSTLPASASKHRLVQTAKMRWRIERDYQELKQELGLNHYEGRSWRGFHHHASLCIAAYGFLVSERLKHPMRKKKRARKTSPLPDGYTPRGAPTYATTC